MTWQDFFAARLTDGGVSGAPAHTTLVEIGSERGLRRRGETFLAKQSAALVAILKAAYKDLV
jgi:hypothetical protein